jgi:hypothetical protein
MVVVLMNFFSFFGYASTSDTMCSLFSYSLRKI